VMRDSADFSKSSNNWGPHASTEGEQRNRCWTRGALNESRKRTSASWAPTRHNLFTALERSEYRSDQWSFKTLPRKSGAPSRVASQGWTRVNDRSKRSSTAKSEWQTSSHFAAFRMRPILEPRSIILLTSWATLLWRLLLLLLLLFNVFVNGPICRQCDIIMTNCGPVI